LPSNVDFNINNELIVLSARYCNKTAVIPLNQKFDEKKNLYAKL